MTDGCFQRIFYTFYPFQFFFIVQILYAKYCARLGVYKLPLGFVGHRLSGEPTQHCHCSITQVLDNKQVYIALFQRGEGRASPRRNERELVAILMAAKNVGQGSVRRLRWRNNRNHKSEALRFQWGRAKAWLVVAVLHPSGPRGFRFAIATLVEESKRSKGQPALGRLGLYCLKLYQLHGAVWTLGRLGCGRMQEPLSHLRVMASSGQSGWITTTKRHIYRGHIQECLSGHH